MLRACASAEERAGRSPGERSHSYHDERQRCPVRRFLRARRPTVPAGPARGRRCCPGRSAQACADCGLAARLEAGGPRRAHAADVLELAVSQLLR